MSDLKGREYAKIDKVREGSFVKVDGDFSCMQRGAVRTVYRSDEGLYISCSEGRHYLDGQIQDNYYLGLYLQSRRFK